MDLARLLAPRDPGLQRVAAEMWAARADLRAAFHHQDSAGFGQWLGVHGLLEDPRVARHFPPLPLETLRATVCGGSSPVSHLYSGAEDFRMVAELFELFAQRPIESLRSVLDFGCGCGRTLRWFQTVLPAVDVHGADVRAAAIAWCAANLRGTFVANGTLPPLPIADGSIELTYALSVFSHLSREQNLAWMRELARVTAPDGLILVSAHGASALALCARSPEHQQLLQIGAEEARELLRRLAREPFLHRVMAAATRRDADGVADDYGQAFCNELFARDSWSEATQFLGSVPCALGLFQDVYALRPRDR